MRGQQAPAHTALVGEWQRQVGLLLLMQDEQHANVHVHVHGEKQLSAARLSDIASAHR